jgi:hypothetical protein
MDTAQDDDEARDIAKVLLEHTGFAGFTFSTQFSLRFSRDRPGTFRGHALPAEVELVLHGDWWLDDLDDWRLRVARLAPVGAVEPEEPVQAYELALLRWTENTTVSSVELSGNSLRLRFGNGRVLTADGDEAEGRSWTIGIPGVDEPSARWWVAADGGALYVRAPRNSSS